MLDIGETDLELTGSEHTGSGPGDRPDGIALWPGERVVAAATIESDPDRHRGGRLRRDGEVVIVIGADRDDLGELDQPSDDVAEGDRAVISEVQRTRGHADRDLPRSGRCR